MIDIIIPVYNSSETLSRTLDSVLNQVNKTDFNVYIIDDDSEEDYDDIVSNYSKDLNINYIKLDSNGGPGVARQYGLDHSSGEYIVFLDSDDTFYEKDSVKNLYDNIDGYDMAIGKIYYEYFDEYSYHNGCLHGKMYRRSLIKDNGLKFNDLRSHEDNAFNQLCLLFGNVIYIDEITYNYNNTNNSLTNTEGEIESYKNYIKSMNTVFKKAEESDIDKIDKEYAGRTITNIMLYCYFNYLLNEEDLSFCFTELSFLRKMYEKYTKYIEYSDLLEEYKNFDYPVVPDITFFDYIKKIKNEN